MQKTPFSRQDVILRPTSGSAGGFVRLETQHGRGSIVIRASQLEAGPLRALLLHGNTATGAVIDLGVMQPAGRRQFSLCREGIPSAPGLFHTVVVCSDWPDPQVLLYGWLTPRPVCTLRDMQEALRRHLAVPAGDTAQIAPPASGLSRLPLCMLLPPRASPGT